MHPDLFRSMYRTWQYREVRHGRMKASAIRDRGDTCPDLDNEIEAAKWRALAARTAKNPIP